MRVRSAMLTLVSAAGAASAQPIMFDNSCGTGQWNGCCQTGSPCFSDNNWDTGVVPCQQGCGILPSFTSDVLITQPITLTGGPTARAHTLVCEAPFMLQGGVMDVSGTADFNGPFENQGGGVLLEGEYNIHMINSAPQTTLAVLNGATLNIIENAEFPESSIQLGDNATFHIAQNGNFNIHGQGTFITTGAPTQVFNEGFFRRHGEGPGPIQFNVPFNNAQTGMVELNGGAVVFQQGGSNAGHFQINPPGYVDLAGGEFEAFNDSGFMGPGGLRITGGNLILHDSSNVMIESLLITGGSILARDNSTIQAPQGIIMLGGEVGGSCRVEGWVTNDSGLLRPHSSLDAACGSISVAGEFFQSDEGQLEIGVHDGCTDTLHADGHAGLAGSLVVNTFAGNLSPGDTFEIITAGDISGEFSSVSAPGFEVQYTPNAVVLIFGGGASCDPDVNCDGNLDGFDVQSMEQAVGGDTSNFCQPDADFNHDGNLDGFDVQAVEAAVGGAPCP